MNICGQSGLRAEAARFMLRCRRQQDEGAEQGKKSHERQKQKNKIKTNPMGQVPGSETQISRKQKFQVFNWCSTSWVQICEHI